MPTTAVLQWLRVTADPGSVKTVRDFVEQCCETWQLEDSSDEAVLVASELATNAVRHARSPVTVWLGRRSDRIVLSVEDASHTPATLRHPAAMDNGGRGLEIVDAVSDRWGERDLADGKLVWAELAIGSGPAERGSIPGQVAVVGEADLSAPHPGRTTMRKARHEAKAPVRPAMVSLPEVDPALRDETDDDPLVEEMVERLRTNLSAMVALDEWGRPVPWRSVVRLAVGPTLSRLRDAETTVALVQRVIELPTEDEASDAGLAIFRPEVDPVRTTAAASTPVAQGSRPDGAT